MTNDNIAKKLKDFLLNIECLSPLENLLLTFLMY